MPRAAIDLSAHRQTITWWIVHEKWDLARVMRTLETQHKISHHVLEEKEIDNSLDHLYRD